MSHSISINEQLKLRRWHTPVVVRKTKRIKNLNAFLINSDSNPVTRKNLFISNINNKKTRKFQYLKVFEFI